MEYGGLSVTDMRSGTPGMPLWCAGSFATSMKVRTLNGQTSYVFTGSGLFYSLPPHHLVYSLVLFFLIFAFSICTASTNKLGKRMLGKRLLFYFVELVIKTKVTARCILILKLLLSFLTVKCCQLVSINFVFIYYMPHPCSKLL